MQGVVWSCTAGRVWYTMCQYVEELRRCIRDASEKCGVQYAGSYSDTSQTMPHTPKPYDNILGLDGKLKPEELECWHKNKLCIVCGSSNHQASECPATK